MAKKYIIEIDNNKILKHGRCSTKLTYEFMRDFCTLLIGKNTKSIVPVYDFQSISEGWYDYRYSYVMEKLNKLSAIEKMFIYVYSEMDEFDSFENRKYSEEESKAIFSYGERKLPELHNFLKTVAPFYFDIHPGNIMKDNLGDYRLIDLEGFRVPREQDRFTLQDLVAL